MDDELKVKVSAIVDDSAGAKRRFKYSLDTLTKSAINKDLPKIEIPISKLNAKSAIKNLKTSIEKEVGDSLEKATYQQARRSQAFLHNLNKQFEKTDNTDLKRREVLQKQINKEEERFISLKSKAQISQKQNNFLLEMERKTAKEIAVIRAASADKLTKLQNKQVKTNPITGKDEYQTKIDAAKNNNAKFIDKYKYNVNKLNKQLDSSNVDKNSESYKKLKNSINDFHKVLRKGSNKTVKLSVIDKESIKSAFTDVKKLNQSIIQSQKLSENAEKTIKKIRNNVENSGKYDTNVNNANTNIDKHRRLGVNEKDLGKIQNALRRVESAKREYDKAMASGDAKQAKDATDALSVANDKLRNSMSQVATKVSKDKSFNDKKKALQNLRLEMQSYIKANDKLKNNSAAFGDFNNIFSGVNKAISTGDIRNVDKLILKFKTLQSEMKEVGLEGQKFGTKLANQFAKFGVYLSAASVFMGLRRAIRSMVTNVVELDKAMTELKKVTDETSATYSRFLDNAESRAKKLGATLTDVVSVTADFARLGYGLGDAEKLADATVLFKNVADGISDVGTASSNIISSMKAFSVSSNDIMRIVDSYNEVGNRYAVSASNIGEALQRSSSALASSGNSMEQSIGLVVAMNETLQDAEKSGTALKTISMRLRNTSGSLQEMGEDADGAAESVTQLQQKIKSLSGVDIMKDKDTFKSTFDIMNELSKVWGNLTDKTQADITRLVAGVRQGNALNALLSNMTTGVKAASTAMGSNGSALAENEKYLDSITGKLSQFHATFESFSNTLIGSSLVKNIVDGGISVVNVLDKITSVLGSIPLLAGLAAGAISGVANKG